MKKLNYSIMFAVTTLILVSLACGSSPSSIETSNNNGNGTLTATPNMLSCRSIEAVKNSYLNQLTWDQYHATGGPVDLYIKSLYGKEIYFHGTVDDVTGGDVFINDDSCDNRLILVGIPDSESIALNKGTVISGQGTVGVFSAYQITLVNVESYKVEK